ncbi:hypothetical protein Gpo141_00002724 [Globisporangium polare]
MQPALDALDRGVAQLFSRPPRRRSLLHDQLQQQHVLPRTPPSSSRSSAFLQPHPLCECLALQPLPDDWQHLRRHPVLKRYVLSRWKHLCSQPDLDQRQHLQQQQQDTLASPSLSSSASAAYARSRAVVVQSVKTLCVVLYQCGLLHERGAEFVRLLVAQTLAHGLGDVVMSVRESHTGELPLRVRMLLLHVVLEQVAGTNCSDDSAHALLQSDAAKQRLIEDLCTSLQEEVLEALATDNSKNPRARAFAGGDSDAGRSVTATPRKSNATTGRKTSLRRELKQSSGSSAFAPKCAFCSHSDEINSTSAAPIAAANVTPWSELQQLLSAIRELLGGIESGSLFPEGAGKPVALKLAALRNLLLRSDVRRRLATRESAHHPHQHHQFQVLDHSGTPHQWSLTVTEYQQLHWITFPQKNCAMKVVNMVLWGNVWEKELTRLSSKAKLVRVDQVIAHCAKADFFARTASVISPRGSDTEGDDDTASLPGYRLVCQVLRAHQIDCFTTILLFLQAWASITSLGTFGFSNVIGYHQVQASTLRTRATTASNSVAGICRAYLLQLLSEAERWLPPSQDVEKKNSDKGAVNGEHLVELLHSLFTIFADAFCGDATGDLQWPSYCRLWDRVLQLSRGVEARDIAHSTGFSWLSGIVLCCNQLNTSSPSASNHRFQDGAFKAAFTSYVLRVVRAIIIGNGRLISSGNELTRKLLVLSETDLNFVREAVTSVLVTSSSTEQSESSHNTKFTSDLIVQLLQSLMYHHYRTWNWEATLRYRRGLDQIFFPAMSSCIRALSKAFPSSTPAKAKVSEEEQFAAILLQATERLKANRGNQAITIALLSFCTDWDTYQLRTRGGVNVNARRPIKTPRMWGRASFMKLQLFADILRVYESESVLIQERDDVLLFLGDVLQGATNCPPALEGKLFRLLTGIKSRLDSHASRESFCVPSPPAIDGDHPQEEDEEVPGADVRPMSLISYSSDPLALFMHQLHTGTLLQVRGAVKNLKSDPLQLDELLRHVLRSIALLQLQDPRAASAFGKETKLSFALLCNRLLCWLPDESVHEIRQAVTPLDQELVQSLTAFAEGYSVQDEDDESLPMNIVSTGSSVRLELLIRSFVYSSVVPDLCELTDVIVNAIIGCTSTESRDALLKLTQRISSALLVEVAVETLRVSLSTECLPYLDRASLNVNEDEDDEDNENGPPGETINRVSNALSIVGLSSALFDCIDISWSSSLFDEQVVQHWLLCFFDCMVFSEQSRALTPIDELLSSLEFLMQAPQGARMVKHSYLLVALLCTAAFPQSRIPQPQWSDFDSSLLEISQALLSALSSPVSAIEEAQASKQDNGDSEVLYVRVEPLRVTRAKVSEEKLELSTTAVSVQSNAPLIKRFQNGYLADDVAQDPGHRVVVRFATWLSSAIIYSQSIAAALTSSSDGSGGGGEEHSWEQLFVDYVVYLFLPLEFDGSVFRLLETWVSVWMRLNLEHAGGDLMVLLPFQQKLFSRVGASCCLQGHHTRREMPQSDPVWKLVFTCVNRVLESVSGNPEAVDAAIVVLDDVMDKFDLVSLSAMGVQTQTAEVLDQFEAVCAHPSMVLLSDIQAIHVLKYPLELAAFFHVTMPPSAEYVIVSSESSVELPRKWEAERALMALQASIHRRREALSPHSESEENGGQQSPEMSAFWYEWTQMIQLKLAFLDPIRCEQFIVAATHALAGVELE